MLTREHLRLRRRGDRAVPVFVRTDDPGWLAAAESVLAVFRAAAHVRGTRGEIDEQLETLCDPAHEIPALVKLAADQSAFADASERDYPKCRAELFAASAALLAGAASPDDLRERLGARPGAAAFLDGDIYGDLPENQRLTAFRDMTARELLERYNLAQVQGLLMFAQSLTVRTPGAEPAELRRLFKYLKFFRLLASVKRDGDGFALTVSGPLAIFANTRKYAVQLAAFVPAAVLLPKWRLEAKIEWKGRVLDLSLDETSALRSPYRNFSAYVPEEIAMFHRLFREKIADWTIVGETPFLTGDRGEVIFPDLSFREAASGRIVHLELFHRWHKGQLEDRLRFLAGEPGLPLVIGIDRSLADEDALAGFLAQWPVLSGRLFLFRDFPGVDRVAKLLREF